MPEQTTRPASRALIASLVAAAVAAIAVALFLVSGGPSGSDSGAAPTQGAKSTKKKPAAPPARARFFSPTSVWNAPLPDDAALDPASDRLASEFAAEIEREKKAGIGPWIQTDEYSTPIWIARAGEEEVRVKLEAGPWGDRLRAALDEGVPIPAEAKPAPGTDGHMTVYQPSTDRLWEFWQARKQGDGWHASWGGAMREVSKSPGYYSSRAWPGAEPNWGSTATSLPVVGGTITIDELRSGRIPHALAMAVPDVRKGEWAWPAQRSDGAGHAQMLPEGARLRIDPKLDLDSLKLSPAGRAIAEAAQRHGMVVRDVTHHAVALYAEDPAPTGSNPYIGAKGLFGGKIPSGVLEGFPWDRLQVLKMSLCRSAPCPRRDSP